MVFYRKYRPQTIEELDSKIVRDAITAALSSKSVSHAFLFTGPKGLGKTSAARIVAKAVNCLAKRDLASPDEKSKLKGQKSKLQLKTQKLRNEGTQDQIEPCNKCYQCTSITNGTNIDVLEIDGASNRGIDEIRDLREKVRLAPAASKKKVYIIDEVHMLTTEAFNALLKTLEEPPMHVIFILCTTEPHKVPATIVSRCFHIAFKKARIEELVRSFKRIIEKEKLSVSEDALDFIASLSDGSFRDGAKILEEMAAFDKKITQELIQNKYQISNIKYQIDEMIRCFSEKDAKKGLVVASELVEQGVDMKYFIEQLISELHRMLLVEVGIYDARGPANESSKFKVQSSKLSVEEIKELVELLARAYGELKYAVLPQLPLELAIVGWSQKSMNQLSSRPSPAQRGVRRDLLHQPSDAGDSSTTLGMTTFRTGSKIVKEADGRTQIWQELIDKVKLYNHSIAGVLRGCGLKSYDKDKIVIETGYKFHKERLEENNNLAILKKVCSEIAGNKIEVSVVLKE